MVFFHNIKVNVKMLMTKWSKKWELIFKFIYIESVKKKLYIGKFYWPYSLSLKRNTQQDKLQSLISPFHSIYILRYWPSQSIAKERGKKVTSVHVLTHERRKFETETAPAILWTLIVPSSGISNIRLAPSSLCNPTFFTAI